MFSNQKTISQTRLFVSYEKPNVISESKSILVSYDKPNAEKQKSSQTIKIFEPRSLPKVDTYNISLVPGVSFVSGKSATITNAFNIEAKSYVNTIKTSRAQLIESNEAYLQKVYSKNPTPTIREFRNTNDWTSVKRVTVQKELMEIKMGGKGKLPLSDAQRTAISKKIENIDLNDLNNPQTKAVIDEVLHPSEKSYMDAFKSFKKTGKIEDCFQIKKIDKLSEVLKDIDLEKISAKEFKYLIDNFIEKIEFHHETSISSDATKQSDINNVNPVKTTTHDLKHTDPKTGKVNYRKPLNGKPIDKVKQLKLTNARRVLKENISGLGFSVAIGLGTGFAIGFIVSLAQNGINPNSIKYAFSAGAQQGVQSAGMAAGGFVIGKTVGAVAGKALSECIKSLVGANAAEATLKKITEVCNMGAAGALVTIAFAVYEFAKLKRAGYNTKESLLRTGKSAALSFTILIISMVAVWAGCPGIVVSIVAGVVMTGYTVAKIQHDKKVAKDISLYSIELCKPILQTA